jgi:glucose uptake protein GlcU
METSPQKTPKRLRIQRNILRVLFMSLYGLCWYSAAKRGTAVETFGAVLFLTVAMNIPASD